MRIQDIRFDKNDSMKNHIAILRAVRDYQITRPEPDRRNVLAKMVAPDPEAEDAMHAIFGGGGQKPSERYSREDLAKHRAAVKKRDAARDAERPVIAMRVRMAQIWDRGQPHDVMPCQMYVVHDFRLGPTDREKEYIGALTRNYGTYDWRTAEEPAQPTLFDFLPRNKMGADAMLAKATPEQLADAQRRALDLANERREELRADRAAYLSRAALISCTNGFVNNAVWEYLQKIKE